MEGYIKFQSKAFWELASKKDEVGIRLASLAAMRRCSQLNYQTNLENFLRINFIACEIDFLILYQENRKRELEELGKDKSFLFTKYPLKDYLVGLRGVEIRNIAEYPLIAMHARMLYWNRRMDILYLEDRKHEIQQQITIHHEECIDGDHTIIHQEECQDKDQKNLIIPNRPEEPATLDDLFVDPNLIGPAIEILRMVDPPLINDNNVYVGSLKSPFKMWLDKLFYKGILNRLPNDKTIARLLENRFKGLTIAKDGSTFRKHSRRAKEIYSIDFDTLISLLSQRGK